MKSKICNCTIGNTKPEEEIIMQGQAIEGLQTVTPYLIIHDLDAVVDFMKNAFGAKELFRAKGSAGGYHCEVSLAGSTLMIGGGGQWKGTPTPGAVHLYVTDVDASYQRALEAGGISLAPPTDQFYGDRDSAIKDVQGNHWYIATHKGASYIPEGMPAVLTYLHPRNAGSLIDFLQRAFGARELGRAQSPDGVIHHAVIAIGNSMIEMGEAHDQWQPMPMTLFLSVNDVDGMYAQAMLAGATSLSEPANQPFGSRVAGVRDPHENVWYLATPNKTS